MARSVTPHPLAGLKAHLLRLAMEYTAKADALRAAAGHLLDDPAGEQVPTTRNTEKKKHHTQTKAWRDAQAARSRAMWAKRRKKQAPKNSA